MVTKVREEDFQQELTSLAETLTSEQVDALETEGWAMAQDTARRALRTSERAELLRVDSEARDGPRLSDKASRQIVTAQTVVDAWRDALAKVKATRARTAGGWRANIASRTKHTSERLLSSEPFDEHQVLAVLMPRERRLQRIVHEVFVFTAEQSRLQQVYEDSLKYHTLTEPDYLSRSSPAEVQRDLHDHQHQLTLRKAVLAMTEAQAALNDAKAARLASTWHDGLLVDDSELQTQKAAAAAEEACVTAYQAVDRLEAMAADEMANVRHSSGGAHAAWILATNQRLWRRAKVAREQQLSELRTWTKGAYGKVKRALRAENQALSWLSNSSNVTMGNISYITTSAEQMVAAMRAQAVALQPILEVLTNRSVAGRKMARGFNKAVGLTAPTDKSQLVVPQDPNPHEQLGEHELSELEKAQRFVAQAERDQQTALAALTIARKADEHGGRLVMQMKNTQLKKVQEVLRYNPTARQIVTNYTRDRAAKLRAEVQHEQQLPEVQHEQQLPAATRLASPAQALEWSATAVTGQNDNDNDNDTSQPEVTSQLVSSTKAEAEHVSTVKPSLELAHVLAPSSSELPSEVEAKQVATTKPKDEAAPPKKSEDQAALKTRQDQAAPEKTETAPVRDTNTELRVKETVPAAQAAPGTPDAEVTGKQSAETIATTVAERDAAAVAAKAKAEAETAEAAAMAAAEAEADAARAAEAAAKAAEKAKADAIAADAAEEAAKAEKAAAKAKAEADAIEAETKARAEEEETDEVAAKATAKATAASDAADGIKTNEQANASQANASVSPLPSPVPSTNMPGELVPDADSRISPSSESPWSSRHTAILLISITLSLFAGYFLAWLYRWLSEGKKTRGMGEGALHSPGSAHAAEPNVKANQPSV
jgi:curved DNA-binding protein CbpA